MKLETVLRLARIATAVFATSSGWLSYGQPTITSHPQNQSVNVGGTATFNVAATGAPPISYQWRKNGNNIAGATSSSLTISNAQSSDAAGYYCQVSNAGGPAWSDTATLTVNNVGTPPTITAHPQSRTVNAGTSTTFSVTATGTAPLSYQWRKNGNNIAGATNSSYSIANAQSGDAAGYYCQVSNSVGVAWSDTAMLTVNSAVPPTITTQPQNQTVPTGASVTFSVAASGSEPFAYQWRKNGIDINGATSSSFSIASAQAGDAAGYYCQISNSVGVAWSDTATLTVQAASAPTITAQPTNQTVGLGGTATFSVTATGSAPLAYQWRKNGNNIAGATNSSYTISNVQSSDGAGYYCQVSNPAGVAWSDTAVLTVGGTSAPSITAHPQTQTVSAGNSVTFSVTATGAAPISYQWRKDGNPINGATSSSYTIAAAQTSDAGSYSVVVTNNGGSATSNAATLTVTSGPSAPVISGQPQNTSAPPGGTATFAVTASGNPAPTYQWRKGSSNLSGATSATLTLTNVQAVNQGSYSVVVSNAHGSVTSNSATLTVISGGTGSLSITDHPRSQRAVQGTNVAFSVTAAGSGTLSYQWRKDSTNVIGATNATLMLTNLQPAQAGTYYAVVTDSTGSKTTIPATLIVEPAAPNAGTQPKIMEVRTAAPGVLVVVLQSPVRYERERALSTSPESLNLATSAWTVNGAQAVAIHRYSMPWEQGPDFVWNDQPGFPHDPSNPMGWPIITRHQIYLRLPAALQEGQTYVISTPYGSTSFAFGQRTTFCESIKVNQVGYSKANTSRFANFGVYMGDGGTLNLGTISYQVFNDFTGQPVWAQPKSATAVDDRGTAVIKSGEYVYRLDLSDVPEGGPYYVYVLGAGRSRSFGVGDTYSEHVARVTMRGLYHQRCGMALEQPYTAWTHASCHNQIASDLRSPADQDEVVVPEGAPMGPMAGGYHDAGDMDHTTAHPQISIAMLSFFEAFPDRFKNHQYNIPRLVNQATIPDVMEEILWGVKLWENLQVMDENDARGEYGGVMCGWSGRNYTDYGDHNAANDPWRYGTMAVREESTAFCAGIFAHTARLLVRSGSEHATRANQLLDRARLAWAYLERTGSLSPGRNRGRTHLVYAALQLYLTVPANDPKSATYHGVFNDAVTALIINGTSGIEREAYAPGDIYYYCQPHHFISYLLPHGRTVISGVHDHLRNRILNYAQRAANGQEAGLLPQHTTYPQGVQSYLGWGKGTSQGRFASALMYATALTADLGTKAAYTNIVAQYADYSLGLNQMGLSYYTGLGTDQPNTPLDCNSYYTKFGVSDGVTANNHRDAAGNPIGNVPGLLVYGPHQDRSNLDYERAISNQIFPAWESLPSMRRYSHGWSLVLGNEYTTHETMLWNALMYAFLYIP